MHQTVYPERGTREQRGKGEAVHGTDAFRARQASIERHPSFPPAPWSEGLVVAAYERFLGLPVAVVLAALWVAGAALVGCGVLILYVIGTSLAS